MSSFQALVIALPLIFSTQNALSLSSPAKGSPEACRQTGVAILGAGIAGITTAPKQALHNQSISDFIILEYQNDIGGRVHHTKFGSDPNGKPYTVELGANWIQGIGDDVGPENPIWRLAKKWRLENRFSNLSNLLTYDQNGAYDFTAEIEALESVFDKVYEDAGEILTQNLQDQTVRAALRLAGWKPRHRELPMAAEAVEWYLWDWEAAQTPEESSLVFGTATSNFTFDQFGDENNLVVDQRGHKYWVKAEASTFLVENDARLLFNHRVTNISHSDEGVVILTDNGECIRADLAVCTFSIGVLQHDDVTFNPPLPKWKNTAISKFEMATYTKIFLQFENRFWPENVEFFLYADPHHRGWYPFFQSLDVLGFLPGSHILFVTVVGRESYHAERQSDAETCEEVMAVLRRMFPHTDVPEPIAFTYPRWTMTPWARGSFSNWPPGTTLEMHQNLRANVGRLWFAGEHTSAGYFGYMQGAWFEGRDVGNRIAGLLGRSCVNEGGPAACGEMVRYETLHGTTELEEYSIANGWPGSSIGETRSD